MSNTPTIYWPGASGKDYKYWIHQIGASFKDEPGNYIFAKEVSPGRWKAVYIGQTNSLYNRLSRHEKEPCAIRNGATHIHAHISSHDQADRLVEEQDLIAHGQPICNKQAAY